MHVFINLYNGFVPIRYLPINLGTYIFSPFFPSIWCFKGLRDTKYLANGRYFFTFSMNISHLVYFVSHLRIPTKVIIGTKELELREVTHTQSSGKK